MSEVVVCGASNLSDVPQSAAYHNKYTKKANQNNLVGFLCG
jgi:hypothetical protein